MAQEAALFHTRRTLATEDRARDYCGCIAFEAKFSGAIYKSICLDDCRILRVE
jgi:hypothetical protein